MIELVDFLGNPGPEYAGNRHNVPWHLAERLLFSPSLNWWKKFKGLWADIEGNRLLSFCPSPDDRSPADVSPPEKVHFIKPGTYMNRSGDSVREAASFFKIKPERIMVIHDELELALNCFS